MGFIKQLLVEALKISEVMRIQVLAAAIVDQGSDLCALFAHRPDCIGEALKVKTRALALWRGSESQQSGRQKQQHLDHLKHRLDDPEHQPQGNG